MTKPVLGRGLSALLGSAATTFRPASVEGTVPPAAGAADAPLDTRERIDRLPISLVRPSSLQPRKDFSAESLQELADSIKAQGILQPLIVRARGEGYELIAGERRWRAAQILGLSEVPAIVRETDDRTVLEMMLIENLQRENLNPIEEAQGYQQLLAQFQLTQEQAAEKVGKSRTVVANSLRLLRLSPAIQLHLREGRLSVGHAKVILGLEREEEQDLAADRVLREGLNVRQTEDLVAHLKDRTAAPFDSQPASHRGRFVRDAHVLELESQLQQRLGTKVSLRYRRGRGLVEIRFYSDDELERILEIVGVKLD
jgi:ParB family transcriptional regulator, chromosome partitioning protein